MSPTDTLDLDSKDIEFLKTLRRTFKSMAMETRSRVEGIAPGTDTRRTNESPSNSTWRANYEAYKVKFDELKQEIHGLRQLFERTSGDQAAKIIKQLEGSPAYINSLDEALSDAVNTGSNRSVAEVARWLRNFWLECGDLEDALYSQKHAFNFIHLRRLKEACKTAETEIGTRKGAEAKLSLVFNDLVPKLAKHDLSHVIDELRTFSTITLPSYVTAEEERATTQYLALTTIATFFSSITATTLQFSYQQTSGGLSSAVNLCWFISLVFSVSSGINSLLSMIWRKSIVYTKSKPPKYINFWLTKAPIAFLAIAAFAFIVGLNLFPYSSDQHIYVSSATNVFTVLHVLGLLIVTSWYLVKLEWSTYFVQHVRRNILWVLQHDDKVLPVNSFIADMINWPAHPKLHPHPFAKLLRHCVAVFSYLIRKSKDVIMSINTWFKQRILHSISNLFKGVYKLTLSTLVGRVKLDFFSLLRRLHFKYSNSTPLDPEAGVNLTPEGSDKEMLSGGVSKVDRAVDKFIGSLDKTFAVQYLQPPFRTMINGWNSGIHSTNYTVIEERNMLWGYPTIYRQFEEEVLPAMRAMDKLRSRPLQAQQQSQDVPAPEGSGPPTVDTLPPIPILRSDGVGGLVEHAGESTTGSASDLNSGHVTGLVSLDGNMNALDQNLVSINSTVEPISVVGGQDFGTAPSLPPIAEEAEVAQASDEVVGEARFRGRESGKDSGISGANTGHRIEPDTACLR